MRSLTRLASCDARGYDFSSWPRLEREIAAFAKLTPSLGPPAPRRVAYTQQLPNPIVTVLGVVAVAALSVFFLLRPRLVEAHVVARHPVSAPWFTWRAWQWLVVRELAEEGTEDPPHWPSAERLALNASCGPGEKERERREGSYRIELEDAEHARYAYVPRGLDQFVALPIGATKTIRVGHDHEIELVGP
jgi:hypothetical protein